MIEGEAAKPANEENKAPGNQAGDIINPPTTLADMKKVKGLGWFLVIIPLIIVFLIIVLWPTIAKPGSDDSQKTINTTGTSQPGNPANSPSTKGTGQEKTLKEKVKWAKKTNIFAIPISFQLRMILLVLLGGALGSYIHMATSYSYYIGFNKFDMDWFWWYLLRLPIGAVLALIFSMLMQGGVFVVPAGGSESQPVTLIGLAALVGMFSRQATEKLREVFDVVFKSKEGKENKAAQDEKDKEAGKE